MEHYGLIMWEELGVMLYKARLHYQQRREMEASVCVSASYYGRPCHSLVNLDVHPSGTNECKWNMSPCKVWMVYEHVNYFSNWQCIKQFICHEIQILMDVFFIWKLLCNLQSVLEKFVCRSHLANGFWSWLLWHL